MRAPLLAIAIAAAGALALGACGEDTPGGGDADASIGGDEGHSPGDPASALVATALTANADHTCALVEGGEVVCWGDNSRSQLGREGDDPAPAAVAGLSGVQALATSDKHTCAITAEGGVRCWGFNGNTQLGDGTHAESATPVDAAGVTGASALALGAAHSCALLAGGGVTCWGRNHVGQLGRGTTSVEEPEPFGVANLTGATAIAAGEEHTCAITADRNVQCWGSGAEGALGTGATSQAEVPGLVVALGFVTDLAVGWKHTLAVWTNGQIAGWGRNATGQLGNGKAVEDYGSVGQAFEPNKIGAIDDAGEPLRDARRVAGGLGHSCATHDEGLWCWGDNAEGQIGNGLAGDDYGATGALERIPVAVDAGGAKLRGVALGRAHTCALDEAGRVLCWGANDKGQLGRSGGGSPLPIYVPAP